MIKMQRINDKMDFECYKHNQILSELFAERPELKKAFMNDATVYAWFKMYLANDCSLQDTLIGIIVYLSKEKQQLFDSIVGLNNRLEQT